MVVLWVRWLRRCGSGGVVRRTTCAVRDEVLVNVGGELVDGPRDVGVRVQLLLGRLEVMVRLGLLERRLAVLADHHERGQEDGFQRNDERERRPGAGFDEEHPGREPENVEVHEVHRAGERRDLVRDMQLELLRTLLLLLEDERTQLMLLLLALGASHVVAPWGAVDSCTETARMRFAMPKAKLNKPNTCASDTAPTSGRTTSTTPRATEMRPVSPNMNLLPAVPPEENAMASSPTPVTNAQMPIQIVKTSAVIPGQAMATTPAATSTNARSSRPKPGPTASSLNARVI